MCILLQHNCFFFSCRESSAYSESQKILFRTLIFISIPHGKARNRIQKTICSFSFRSLRPYKFTFFFSYTAQQFKQKQHQFLFPFDVPCSAQVLLSITILTLNRLRKTTSGCPTFFNTASFLNRLRETTSGILLHTVSFLNCLPSLAHPGP